MNLKNGNNKTLPKNNNNKPDNNKANGGVKSNNNKIKSNLLFYLLFSKWIQFKGCPTIYLFSKFSKEN